MNNFFSFFSVLLTLSVYGQLVAAEDLKGLLAGERISTSDVGSEKEQSQFYSQASQDQFVNALLYTLSGKKDEGYYLEIGTGDPVTLNDTYFFEKNHNWKGVSLDLATNLPELWKRYRTNPLVLENATKVDYTKILEPFPQMIDYLVIDTDGDYDAVLKQIPFDLYLFKVITIEHDAYRYGSEYREKERKILMSYGYYLLCPDVSHPHCGSFEDWWIHPSVFDEPTFLLLASLDLKAKDHALIIKTLGNLTNDNPEAEEVK